MGTWEARMVGVDPRWEALSSSLISLFRHIECSAMAGEAFGSYVDLHTGGYEVLFSQEGKHLHQHQQHQHHHHHHYHRHHFYSACLLTFISSVIELICSFLIMKTKLLNLVCIEGRIQLIPPHPNYYINKWYRVVFWV